MNATAQQTELEDLAQPRIDPVYLTRDDLARAFPPANPCELKLLTVAALALERLLHAYALERRLFEQHDPLELLLTKPETFKTIARHISDCNRIWRTSIEALERAHRTRAKEERNQTSILRPRLVYIDPAEDPLRSSHSPLAPSKKPPAGLAPRPPLSG